MTDARDADSLFQLAKYIDNATHYLSGSKFTPEIDEMARAVDDWLASGGGDDVPAKMLRSAVASALADNSRLMLVDPLVCPILNAKEFRSQLFSTPAQPRVKQWHEQLSNWAQNPRSAISTDFELAMFGSFVTHEILELSLPNFSHDTLRLQSKRSKDDFDRNGSPMTYWSREALDFLFISSALPLTVQTELTDTGPKQSAKHNSPDKTSGTSTDGD